MASQSVLACGPPPRTPGDVIIDAVAIETIDLPRPWETDSLLGWANRRWIVVFRSDVKTRFRVVEYFRGGGDDVVEIEHVDLAGNAAGADCEGVMFEPGERVFIHAYYGENDRLWASRDVVAFGENRQRHLEWARSPRFWLEGSTPYDDVPEFPRGEN